MKHEVAVVVFSRAPIPGASKRRLMPALGAEGAADLQARMTERMVASAVAADIGPVVLWCHPDPEHPYFLDLARRYPVARESQGEGDLGRKMHRAIDTTLAAHRHVILVGCDCPALDARVLSEGARKLRCHDAVLGAANDGGYVLIGMNRPDWRLFDGLDWGTDQVLTQTRERLAHLGWQHQELGPFDDIDRPADLVHLPPDL